MPGKRINFKQRVIIQTLIEDNHTKSLSEVSRKRGLNRTSIYREIINRRISKGSKRTRFLKEKPTPCELLKIFPFCCNRCYKKKSCSKEIFIYDAYHADETFKYTKYHCLKGPKLTTKQLEHLDQQVSPRVLSGQSLYHIVTSNNEIKSSERTIRRYIKNNYLTAKVIDLPRTVQRKTNDVIIEKRNHVNPAILKGRMYDDYLLFKKEYLESVTIQIDTMIGKRNDKKVILTIYEPTTKLQIGLLQNQLTSRLKD